MQPFVGFVMCCSRYHESSSTALGTSRKKLVVLFQFTQNSQNSVSGSTRQFGADNFRTDSKPIFLLLEKRQTKFLKAFLNFNGKRKKTFVLNSKDIACSIFQLYPPDLKNAQRCFFQNLVISWTLFYEFSYSDTVFVQFSPASSIFYLNFCTFSIVFCISTPTAELVLCVHRLHLFLFLVYLLFCAVKPVLRNVALYQFCNGISSLQDRILFRKLYILCNRFLSISHFLIFCRTIRPVFLPFVLRVCFFVVDQIFKVHSSISIALFAQLFTGSFCFLFDFAFNKFINNFLVLQKKTVSNY